MIFQFTLFKFESSPEQRTSGSGKYYTLLISFAIGFALIDTNELLSNEYRRNNVKPNRLNTNTKNHTKKNC